ncbi:MAG: hypothetical protein EBY75_08260, partial [Actinobacteria bacterium]|nr:hypothetical protein [Actinomycetota bacterium]
DTIVFGSTVDSDGATARALTITTGSNTPTVRFDDVVGGTNPLGAIAITGALDLNAIIQKTTGSAAGATSLTVSGVSDLGANVNTSGIQTYTGAVTLSGGDRTLTGSTITNSSTIAGGTNSLAITGASVINGAISGVNIFSVSGTTSLGADVTTTADVVTFSSTVNSTASQANNLTFGSGSGNATFAGAVGTGTNGALGTITNIAGQTVTFSDAVTATTIANYGTLLFNATSAKTISAAITDNDTTIIQVINSLTTDVAPGIITFSGTVATDTLTIGSGSSGGSATFTGSGGVTAATTTITGGSTGTSKNSTATFNYALSGTSVTLDDVTSGGTATIVFAGANSVTIAPTIAGASAGEGTISITGTNKTFTGEIGGTNGAANVGAINIAASQTGTFKNNVAATTTTTSGTMVIDSAATPAAITVRGAINGSAANTGNLTVQNSGGTTFTGIIG